MIFQGPTPRPISTLGSIIISLIFHYEMRTLAIVCDLDLSKYYLCFLRTGELLLDDSEH